MIRPQGYAVTQQPGKADVEEDTLTCAHCNLIIFLPAGFILPADLVRKCTSCDRFVCADCGGNAIVFDDQTGRVEQAACDPFEKKLERMEARGRFLKDVQNG